MRIWKGKEMEGRFLGYDTLFVEDGIIDDCLLSKVFQILERLKNEGEEIDQIYFGAGNINVSIISSDATEKLKELGAEYLLSVECRNYIEVDPKYFDHIILTNDFKLEEYDAKYSIKLKTEKDVFVFPIETGVRTSLNKLEKGMFKGTDTLLYDEEEI